MNTSTEIPETNNSFVGKLYALARREDRGKLADLRRGLSDGTQQSAWPVLGAFGAFQSSIPLLVFQSVGAFFALHPHIARFGNMGTTCRRLRHEQDMSKPDPFDARFRRLLACDSLDDLCGQLVGVVKMAKANDVPVDYDRLFTDLRWFDNNPQRVKIDWAKHYWGEVEKKSTSDGDKKEVDQ